MAAGEEIYATLYAQRMFFRVTSQPQGTSFEAMPFSDARHHAEQNLLRLRRISRRSCRSGKSCLIRPLSEPVGSLAQRYQALLEELPAGVKLLAVSKGAPR